MCWTRGGLLAEDAGFEAGQSRGGKARKMAVKEIIEDLVGRGELDFIQVPLQRSKSYRVAPIGTSKWLDKRSKDWANAAAPVLIRHIVV